MSNLALQFYEPWAAAPVGLTVEAWAASGFTSFPENQPSAYPPAAAPVATGLTIAGGTCTLTGLTIGTSYYISVIDAANQPHFFDGTAYVGGGTLVCRYTPASPPAATAGGMTLIQSIDVTGTPLATFSSIPQTYKHLKVIGDLGSGNSGVTTDLANFRINSVSSGYAWQELLLTGGGGGGPTSVVSPSATFGRLASVPGPLSGANSASMEINFPNYTDLTQLLTWHWTMGWFDNASNGTIGFGAGVLWGGTAAISALSFSVGGSWALDNINARLSLYGIEG